MASIETARPKTVFRLARPLQEFIATEAAGGILLLACAIVALVLANSPWASTWTGLWHTPVPVGSGDFRLEHDLEFWINDGLMAVFFLVVGLEIKRELLAGELASIRQATLPVLAALGGVGVPALLYSALNAGGAGARGWGIPMATDIAFAVGAMAVLGARVPAALKVFVTALAIVDDLAAVIVIAVFYTASIDFAALGLAAICVLLLLALNRLGVSRLLPYVLPGVVLWAALLASGIHATIAGVLLAFTIPCRPVAPGADPRVDSPLYWLEHKLHPWVTFGVMPLFALVNAGVALPGDFGKAAGNLITIGVMLGLGLGKPIGITVTSWLAVRSGWARLPEGVSWKQLHGVGWLAGIGFTMSFFMAALSFADETAIMAAKIGILTASLLSGIIGSVVLVRSSHPPGELQ